MNKEGKRSANSRVFFMSVHSHKLALTAALLTHLTLYLCGDLYYAMNNDGLSL